MRRIKTKTHNNDMGNSNHHSNDINKNDKNNANNNKNNQNNETNNYTNKYDAGGQEAGARKMLCGACLCQRALEPRATP